MTVHGSLTFGRRRDFAGLTSTSTLALYVCLLALEKHRYVQRIVNSRIMHHAMLISFLARLFWSLVGNHASTGFAVAGKVGSHTVGPQARHSQHHLQSTEITPTYSTVYW